MRRRLLTAVVGCFIAASCGDVSPSGTDASVAATSSIPIPTPTSTTTSTSPTSSTSTLPSSSTVPLAEIEADPLLAGVRLLNEAWSTVEAWDDGFVRIEAVASGPGLPSRDSPVGRLFSDDVFEAIEDAGATDVLEAFSAVSAAGLLSEVQAVLSEHPEAFDALIGPASLSMTGATTTDGLDWTEFEVPFLAVGGLRGSASDGAHLVLVLGPPNPTELVVATTANLRDWSTTTMSAPEGASGGDPEIVRLTNGWLIHPDSYEVAAEGGAIVFDDGTNVPAPMPNDLFGYGYEGTDAGAMAWSWEDSRMWFSPDGIAWDERPLPEGVSSVNRLAGVDGGALLNGYSRAAGEQQLWRATPDGRDWSLVDTLTPEISWTPWIDSSYHRGIAQVMDIPGVGRGNAIKPPVDHLTTLEHEGRRYDFDFRGLTNTITVRDLASDDTLVVSNGQFIEFGEWTNFGVLDGEVLISSGPGTELAAVAPSALFMPADEAAVAAAEASLTPEHEALWERRYVLHSADGLTWTSYVAPPSESYGPWVVALNGSRAMLQNEAGMWVVDLAV